MKFNKDNLKQIRADLTGALAVIAKNHGIQISVGSISFSEEQFTTKLTVLGGEVANPEASSNADTKWKSAFLKYASVYGLSRTDLGKEVTIYGTKYVIAGARPKANKPIVLQKPDGAFVAHAYQPVATALKQLAA